MVYPDVPPPLKVFSSSLLPVSLPVMLTGMLNGFHDLNIACAPAEVSSYGLFNLFLACLRIFIEQGLCRQYHARGTKSALNSSALQKSLLNPMEIGSSCKILDRSNLLANGIHGQDQ